MFRRTVYPALEAHLSRPQVTVITGMRRVGKTTAIKYLLSLVDHNNKIYLDLERIENRHLFSLPSYVESERAIAQLGIDLSKPAVIALDEIQLVRHIPSIIKTWYDAFGVKFLVTGSSSYYLKNHFTESLAGRKQIFELWPLDFKEFLQFRGIYSDVLEKERLRNFSAIYYQKLQPYYEEYLRYGGFPEVVLADRSEDKTAYLRDIVNAYIELDVKLLSDFDQSATLFRLLLLLSGRVGSKVDYSKIGSILGISRHRVKEYIHLFEYTYFIKLITPLARGIDKELTASPKIYFSDTGVLNVLQKGLSSGHFFENAIALQLSRLGTVNYFEKSRSMEIDFIVDGNHAYEVKETPTPQDYTTAKRNASEVGIEGCSLIGRYRNESGFNDFIWGGNIF